MFSLPFFTFEYERRTFDEIVKEKHVFRQNLHSFISADDQSEKKKKCCMVQSNAYVCNDKHDNDTFSKAGVDSACKHYLSETVFYEFIQNVIFL